MWSRERLHSPIQSLKEAIFARRSDQARFITSSPPRTIPSPSFRPSPMDPMDTNYASMSAPFPSPSSSQPSQYFMQRQQQQQQQSSASVPRSPPRSQPLTFPKLPIQPQQQRQTLHSQLQPCGQEHDPYAMSKEKDFCLVAEAAKRAQMAVLMRDMGDLGVALR